MRSKVHYKDEPMELEIVKDFLPPPDQLVLKEDSRKVTIRLSSRSVEFFKKQARRRHTQYQRMIRQVLDFYATRYQSH